MPLNVTHWTLKSGVNHLQSSEQLFYYTSYETIVQGEVRKKKMHKSNPGSSGNGLFLCECTNVFLRTYISILDVYSPPLNS